MDVQIIIDSLPKLLSATVTTIELLILSLVFGMCLSIPIALARLSRNPLLWMPAYGYIFFFRGSPLLIQLFLIYYGLGQFELVRESFLWPIFRQGYWCAIIALTLNTAGYTAEILRGAIQGVPHGEIEAGRACGMSRILLFRRIVAPKALRLVLPAYSNEVILMLQATSLASLVTVVDLMGAASNIVNRSFALYEIYITAGLIYLVMTYAIAWGFKRVEHRLSGHLRERETPAAAAQSEAAVVPGTH
ncbi:MAG: ABC transporter permease [Alphaproteobacteria bacterium]|nr:MAG: ABC transporter permease [Alphaproteobacteria bacterium]